MVTEMRFFVAGHPVSQGSMKCIGNRGGFHQLIASNKTELNEWRDLVGARASSAALFRGWQPLDCAEVRMIFRFDRPKSHYRTGRYADLLRDDAPTYPVGPPDADKLARAVFDSLTAAAVVTDDAVIVTTAIAKRYCTTDQHPGVNIVLSAPAAAQPVLLEVTA